MDDSTSLGLSKTKSKSMAFNMIAIGIGLIIVLGQLSTVDCAYNEFDRQNWLDTLRSLGLYSDLNLNNYPELISDYKEPIRKFHQLERKGGRAPTLRLRFGRRSDPNWPPLMKSSQEIVN